jgi:hypothetical protein
MMTAPAAAGNPARKLLKRTRDPLGLKPRQVCEAPKRMTDAERAAACPGVLLPHATDVGLGPGVVLPAPDIKGKRSHGEVLLTNDIVKKYAPRPATKFVPCAECFARMRAGPLHKCHVLANKRVCQRCTHYASQDCVPVSQSPSLYIVRG